MWLTFPLTFTPTWERPVTKVEWMPYWNHFFAARADAELTQAQEGYARQRSVYNEGEHVHAIDRD